MNTKHKNITVNSKSKKAQDQTKIEEINVTILKDIDEAIELAQLLTYANKTPVSQLHTTIIPAKDYVRLRLVQPLSESNADR